jgi:phosphoribosylformylglycinamidine cyclo-ligase
MCSLRTNLFPIFEKCLWTSAPDGIGTKTVIIDAAHSWKKAAWDLLAMTASDITRWGGLPLVFSNVLDIASLGKKGDATHNAVQDLFLGLRNAAYAQGIALVNGETASLGRYVASENPQATLVFNWSGVMLGVYNPDFVINGSSLAPGQIVVALQEEGFRSNGMRLVRYALIRKFGKKWWENSNAESAIQECATPSVLYDSFFAVMNDWYGRGRRLPMHGIVHLSGDPFRQKFAKDILFARGLSAELDDLFAPPLIMQECKEWSRMTDEDAYANWNGGQGMLVVLDEEYVSEFISQAALFRIPAKVCGRITKRDEPTLTIFSKFSNGKIVEFTSAV